MRHAHSETLAAAADMLLRWRRLSGEVAARAQHLAKTGNPTPVLPFGVTLIGPAWSDESLWAIAARFHEASGLGCGPEGHGVKPYRARG